MQGFDAASRFSLTDAPAMAPGIDFITRSDKGPFVDTGRDITFNETGRAYLSLETLREMAEGAGLFEPIREEARLQYDKGHAAGYIEALEENLGGRIAALSDELGHLAGWLADPARLVSDEGASGGADQEPTVPVTDGRATPEGPFGAHEGAEGSISGVDALALAGDDGAPESHEGSGNPFGQGARPRRNKRPSLVPAGSGDGNAYQL